MLPPLLGEAIKVLKLSNLLFFHVLDDTSRFVWSRVFILAALTTVEVRGDVEMSPMGSFFTLLKLFPLPSCPLPIINTQGSSREKRTLKISHSHVGANHCWC